MVKEKKYILPTPNDEDFIALQESAFGGGILDMRDTQLKARTTEVDSFTEDLGQQVFDSRTKNADEDYQIPVIDLAREMMKEWPAYLERAINEGIEKYVGDFFVVILTKHEQVMKEVFRAYFVTRESCPLPNYDQTVYQYIKTESELRYLWTIPDKDMCYELLEVPAGKISKEDAPLLGFVQEFASGSLDTYAKKLNGEI